MAADEDRHRTLLRGAVGCHLRNRDVFAGKKVGVIVTGGNVDLSKLPWMLK